MASRRKVENKKVEIIIFRVRDNVYLSLHFEFFQYMSIYINWRPVNIL